MRLAVYNVENLFDRPCAMNLDTWAEGRKTLEWFSELSQLLGELKYTDKSKNRMVELLGLLGLEKSDQGPFVTLRRNRGKLLSRPKDQKPVITASGRAEWSGTLELRREPVNEVAMLNTARVIRDLKADVLGVVEAENRPGLVQFNDVLLPAAGGDPFRHIMLIDGNDSRGIDVGLLTGDGYPIGNVQSHVDDRDAKDNAIFSRDCPEYSVTTPSGKKILILLNHLKSKGYGGQVSSDARRKAQAERVAEIYRERSKAGQRYIVVMGDFNDTPSSAALAPLLAGTDLTDAFMHPKFDKGGYDGTYGLCNASNKIDFMLLSPDLYKLVNSGGLVRMGMWPGVKPKRWDTYDELTKDYEAASDHAAVWVELGGV